MHTEDEHMPRVDATRCMVVTGCAGLIGSHLTEALLARGDTVIGIDNLRTGQRANVELFERHRRFTFHEHDVNDAAAMADLGPFDAMVHLASPASPTDFSEMSFEILETGSIGTFNTVRAAAAVGARFVLASTSEVYGEPTVHPQPEEYWGYVNPIGPRACYDEAKRFSEAVVSTWTRRGELDGAIARFFNTYGPRMRIDDGRVVSNFVTQALLGEPLTIQGDGQQTRSYCYVDDLVAGVLALVDSDVRGPVNLGNPVEFTVTELAEMIIRLTGSSSGIVHGPLPEDDPTHRRPDITRASEALGWEPTVPLEVGLGRVIEHFEGLLADRATHAADVGSR